MKPLAALFCPFVVLLAVSVASAQQPQPHQITDEQKLLDFVPSPTEEMWFYLQEMRRYEDPQKAIRRRAEFKAAQRLLRIESQKWHGHSPSRPNADAALQTVRPEYVWVHKPDDPYLWVGSGVATLARRVAVEVISDE
jgi:hypothetical protein